MRFHMPLALLILTAFVGCNSGNVDNVATDNSPQPTQEPQTVQETQSDPNDKPRIQEDFSVTEQTPPMDIWTAAATGNINAVEKQLIAGIEVNDGDELDSNTPLIWAAFMGQTEVVEWLIDHGAILSNKNAMGITPLHAAAFAGRMETVRMLLDKGADLKARTAEGQTPRDLVAQEWNTDLQQTYREIEQRYQVNLDLEAIRILRPKVVELFNQTQTETLAGTRGSPDSPDSNSEKIPDVTSLSDKSPYRELTTDDLFQTDRVLDVQITVAEEDWDKIRHQSRNFFTALQAQRKFHPIDHPYTYVTAKVTIDGVEFPEVGLRKKGFIGSQNSDRPSLKIKLNHADQNSNIQGLTMLTFNNNQQDVSHISQVMGYALFNAAGSPAPRCTHAKITVNGTSLGIYSHVESVRKPLIKRAFHNKEGTLYEGTVVDFYEDWEGSFELKFGDDAYGRKKILALIGALQGGESETILGSNAYGYGWVPLSTSNPGAGSVAAYPGSASTDKALLELESRITSLRKDLAATTPERVAAQATWEAEAVKRVAFSPWSMIGPFESENFDESYSQGFPPESRIDLDATYGELGWVPVEEYTDGRPFQIDDQANSATYFFRTITAPSARKLIVSLGSDDSIKLWLNGRMQFENKVQRALEPNQDRVELDLMAGENQLLVKVVNGVGDAGLFFDPLMQSLPAPLIEVLSIPSSDRNSAQQELVSDYFRESAPELEPIRDKLAALAQQHYERWTLPDFDDSQWTPGRNGAGYDTETDFGSLISEPFDFKDHLYNKSESLYLRFPFEIEDMDRILSSGRITLRMKCDDGFVAYLNGHQVTSFHAPDNPRWNSRAIEAHEDGSAMRFMPFDLTGHKDKFVLGRNVLAIHGLNIDSGSSDMLITAEIAISTYDYEQAIGELVDLDAFYTFWAIEGLLGFWDGYSGNNNNFFIYLNPATDKFHFLPWGADALFEKFSKLGVDPRAPFSVKTKGLVAHTLYQLQSGRERYSRTLKTIMDEFWDEDALLAETDRIETLLKPHLHSSQWRFSQALDTRRQFIRTRRAEILAEIADGMPEWVTTPEPPFVMGDFMGQDDEDSIWTAVRRGDVEELKEYLADGTKVNERNDDGITLLSMAALAGEIETVQLLIDEGADLDAKNNDGNTALHGTAFLGRLEMTNLLIESGADVNIRNDDGATPLDTAAAEWSQELEGAVGFIAAILRIKAEIPEVKAGRPRVAAVLRTHGSGRAIGQTGLGQDDEDSIWTAVRRGDVEELKEYLADGTKVNERNDDGITLLSMAALAGEIETVQLLIDEGADLDAKNNDGNTALHGTAFLGRLEMTNLLIESGADVNIRNNDGTTPLDNAAAEWSQELEGAVGFIAGILRIKAEVSEVKVGRPRVAAVLRTQGGTHGSGLAVNQAGQGEIGRLVKDGDLTALREAFTKGADVNGLDAQGITPLSWAAMADQLEVAKLLLNLGSEVNGKNRDGATPLHGAAGLGRTEIVELLLSKGADVNVIDGDGQTPLDKAAAPWSPGLEGLIRLVAGILQLKVEVSEVKTGRSQVAEILKGKDAKTGEALR